MNIRDISKIAGVSAATVSKIINNKADNISEKTKKRVLDIVKKYNYTPYSNISKSINSFNIGVLINDNTNHKLLAGIIEGIQNDNYTPIIFNSLNDPNLELKYIKLICSKHVDGIILDLISTNEEVINFIDSNNIPFIKFGKNSDIPSIPYDNFSYILTQELIDVGHEKIACILDPMQNKSSFLEGFQACISDNNLSNDNHLVFENLSDLILSSLNKNEISALITNSYKKAIEIYNTVSSLHYQIPQDFSLTTIKYDSDEEMTYPSLSNAIISFRDYGIFIYKCLYNKIHNIPIAKTYHQELKVEQNLTVTPPSRVLKNSHILVIGSINIDNYLNTDKLPNSGRVVISPESFSYPGGKGLNQAVGVSLLGKNVNIIANVGSDNYSNDIYRILQEYSIKNIGIKRINGTSTGQAYIFVENSGKSVISILSGANSTLNADSIQERKNLFKNCSFCLISSEIPHDAIEKACYLCKKNNIKIILKPTACDSISQSILEQIDYLIPNESELNQLTNLDGFSIEDKTKYLLDRGVQNVIVTLGSQGCFLHNNATKAYYDGIKFTTIDETGAADAFISALSVYLANGFTLDSSIKIANYAGAFSVLKQGVISSLIDKKSLEAYISKNKPELLNKNL